jgi:hypothetical protein
MSVPSTNGAEEHRVDVFGRQYGVNVSEAPVELIALIDDDGRMSARRDGEPSFTGVQGVADAIISALSRGVDLVVPSDLLNENRGDFPPDLPPYIKIR